MVELLLVNKADIAAKTLEGNGETALDLAAMNEKKDVVRSLVLHKAEHTIFDAVAIGDQQRITELLKDNNGVASSVGQYGYTPLSIAAITGQKDAAALLLANNAAVDARDNQGETVLNAALNGHANVVELLLANKADVNARDKDGHSPLEYAASAGHMHVVKMLLQNKADLNAKDSSGFSPLFQAVKNGHTEAAELLMDAKANPNVKYFDGTTPLHFAVIAGDIPLVRSLLAGGADVNARDRQGLTPLNYASGHGKDMVDLLRQNRGKE